MSVARAVAVALALAALAVPSATAAKPHWILKGKVTRLTHHTITVHGKTCTITPASPKPWIHVDIVGSTVKIVCDGGVLLTIDLTHVSGSTSIGQPGQPGQSVTVTGQSVTTGSNVTSSSNVVSSSSSSTGSAGASALSLAGDFTVTAVGNGSISVKGSRPNTFTCKLDSSSPDVSSFHVGARVSKMTCKNDVLTSIA